MLKVLNWTALLIIILLSVCMYFFWINSSYNAFVFLTLYVFCILFLAVFVV